MSKRSACRHTHGIDLEGAARGFAAIGSEPRLDVLLALVRAGQNGLSVGEIQTRVDIPASTLAHHLKFLAAADLIDQRRAGRVVMNHAAYDRLEALASFLLSECCSDSREMAEVHDTRPADHVTAAAPSTDHVPNGTPKEGAKA